MRNLILLLGISSLLILSACKKDDDSPQSDTQLDTNLESALTEASNGAGKSFYILPESNDYNSIPQDPLNPITDSKVELGKLLYHESGIALAPMLDIGKETYSCSSCHFASAGFQACRVQGIADGGIGFGKNGEGRDRGSFYQADQLDVQPLRTPTAMNGAYQTNMLWNGQFGGTGVNIGTEDLWTVDTPLENNNMGFEGLETQAIAGLGVHRLVVNKEITDDLGYTPMFDEAFPDIDVDKRYSVEYAGLAIAAYERTILANKAPFQEWLRGDNQALTDQEKRGAILFFKNTNCTSCHNGPALNAMEFHALGMNNLDDNPEEIFITPDLEKANKGRGGFTGNPMDDYKFKVPQLYNLKETPFYGHGSSFRSIEEVIRYKNNALAQNPDVPTSQLAEEFVPQGLSDSEIEDITAFIENGLQDPDLKRYVPESVLSNNCFPFNDPLARSELGCD